MPHPAFAGLKSSGNLFMKNEIESFIKELASAPEDVQREMLCHYRLMTSACRDCPDTGCPKRMPDEVPDYTKDIDPQARAEYVVYTGKDLLFAVPNPETMYPLFCGVIRDLARGKYKDLFKEE